VLHVYGRVMRGFVAKMSKADALALGPWEKWNLIDNNGGSLESGHFISLQASNGRYMVTEDGGGSTLEANRTSSGGWETFRIWKIGGSGVIHSGDRIALQSSNGKYVAAENGGGGEVNANCSSIGAWETLKVSFVGW